MNHGDYQTFLQTRKAAEAGQPKAQYNLGLMYANGVGVVQDFAQAMRWYQKSADKGYAPAQYILAGKYANGQGVERDLRKALSWYLKASEKGNSRALFKLGQMFSVPQDEFAAECFEKAAEKGIVEAQMIVGAKLEAQEGGQEKTAGWYRRAAENGFAAAQFMLGTRCQNGVDGPPDLAQAIVWYRRAARQGYAAAQLQLGQMYLEGEGVSRDYRQAAGWLTRAAEQGEVEAQFRLAEILEKGLGGTADPVQAEAWYLRAAAQNDVRACLRLGQLLEDEQPREAFEHYRRAAELGSPEACLALGVAHVAGERLPRDLGKGVEYLQRAAGLGNLEALERLAEVVDGESLALSTQWYRAAAEQGSGRGQLALANRLACGQGVPENPREALFWYRLAAEQGLPEAQHALADACLAEGDEQLPEALEWYRKAARQGFARAQSALGYLYMEGRGVPKDRRQAASWWLKAAEQGDTDAAFQLGQLFEQGGGASAAKHAEQWYRRAIEHGDRERSLAALVRLLARVESPVAEIWFEQAALQGVADGQFLHGQALQRRDPVAHGIESLSFYMQAAVQGNAAALQRMAQWCRDDPAALAELFEQLAAQKPPVEEAIERAPVESLRDGAVAGDPRAQWGLAKAYEGGEPGVAREEEKALYWYRQAALAGFPAAQAALAVRLAQGSGVPQDNAEAVYWWRKAAEQGDAESQYNLALMYEKGLGVTVDQTEAAKWLEAAARQGVLMAQTRLGLAHATGRLGEVSLVDAYAWFATAAMAGNEVAQANREYAESLMSPSELKEAKRRAEQLARLMLGKVSGRNA